MLWTPAGDDRVASGDPQEPGLTGSGTIEGLPSSIPAVDAAWEIRESTGHARDRTFDSPDIGRALPATLSL